ncbi:PH domain-containing protein [Kitasatospora cinereorecta]|uniref:PH domain-containing protein n=1 Tax=Kitasatospora cinereorecta TaxID=285560 RepID=A0ABW0VQG2_9ACTN
MFPAPPLPAAPPFTPAAADQWRATRVWRRGETRWLALLPLAVALLAMVSDTSCPTPTACSDVSRWPAVLAASLLVAEFFVLLARPRNLWLVPAVTGGLLWLIPDGLPNQLTSSASLLAHGLLAAALGRVELGRRRARAQVETLMGPPLPYPWTAAGATAAPTTGWTPWIRRALGALLLTGAAVLAVLGAVDLNDSETRAAAATRVEGTVVAADRDYVEVRFPLPGSRRATTARLDNVWDDTPKPGDPLVVLADEQGFVLVAGDTFDPSGWAAGATASGTLGILLLASAARSVRRRRALTEPGAPALAVQVTLDGHGSPAIHPVGEDTGLPAVWRMRVRESCSYTATDDNDPTWLHEDTLSKQADHADEFEAYGVDEAARILEQAGQPVPGLLYQGPDGASAQVLVYRPPTPGADWVADIADERPLPRRLVRRKPGRLEQELAVPALAAKTLSAVPDLPDAPREPARVFGMPAALRMTAGPLTAALLSGLVVLASPHTLVGGLLRPLAFGSGAFIWTVAALGWQISIDRDGVSTAGALRHQRIPWAQVKAAAVHRGSLVIKLTDGRENSRGSLPGRLLHRHLGGPSSPAEAAETITLLAHRPARRPLETPTLPPIGRPQLLINRLSLAAFLTFALAHYFL